MIRNNQGSMLIFLLEAISMNNITYIQWELGCLQIMDSNIDDIRSKDKPIMLLINPGSQKMSLNWKILLLVKSISNVKWWY